MGGTSRRIEIGGEKLKSKQLQEERRQVMSNEILLSNTFQMKKHVDIDTALALIATHFSPTLTAFPT